MMALVTSSGLATSAPAGASTAAAAAEAGLAAAPLATGAAAGAASGGSGGNSSSGGGGGRAGAAAALGLTSRPAADGGTGQSDRWLAAPPSSRCLPACGATGGPPPGCRHCTLTRWCWRGCLVQQGRRAAFQGWWADGRALQGRWAALKRRRAIGHGCSNPAPVDRHKLVSMLDDAGPPAVAVAGGAAQENQGAMWGVQWPWAGWVAVRPGPMQDRPIASGNGPSPSKSHLLRPPVCRSTQHTPSF